MLFPAVKYSSAVQNCTPAPEVLVTNALGRFGCKSRTGSGIEMFAEWATNDFPPIVQIATE
jgi:hypothetical protein